MSSVVEVDKIYLQVKSQCCLCGKRKDDVRIRIGKYKACDKCFSLRKEFLEFLHRNEHSFPFDLGDKK